tara:strand:+ start:680 stop:898 length:219 start_codon:yes stop_codon:yes gene_type:complete
METYANNQFLGKVRLLSINIDFEKLDNETTEKLFEVKTISEKKSKDILFLKTILFENKKITVQATALWSKDF